MSTSPVYQFVDALLAARKKANAEGRKGPYVAYVNATFAAELLCSVGALAYSCKMPSSQPEIADRVLLGTILGIEVWVMEQDEPLKVMRYGDTFKPTAGANAAK